MFLTWLKTCSACGQKKESSEFRVDNTRPDGRDGTCAECKSTYQKRHYQNHDRKPPTTGQRMCTRCRTIKPFSDFYRNKARSLGVNSHCKACHRNVQAEYRRRQRAQKEQQAAWLRA